MRSKGSRFASISASERVSALRTSWPSNFNSLLRAANASRSGPMDSILAITTLRQELRFHAFQQPECQQHSNRSLLKVMRDAPWMVVADMILGRSCLRIQQAPGYPALVGVGFNQ